MNILDNAIDALQIKSKNNKIISMTAKEKDDMVEIIISNPGKPLEDHVMGKMFNPFFTTKALGKGSGIGLYISMIIIENHMGGSIEYENQENQVCCIIKLPLTVKENSAEGDDGERN